MKIQPIGHAPHTVKPIRRDAEGERTSAIEEVIAPRGDAVDLGSTGAGSASNAPVIAAEDEAAAAAALLAPLSAGAERVHKPFDTLLAAQLILG